MKTIASSAAVLGAVVYLLPAAAAQTRVGALAQVYPFDRPFGWFWAYFGLSMSVSC